MHLLYLKLIHDLADAFAAGSNNTSMNSAVQGDVFRDHLLKLIHNSLNGITCCYGFMFIPSNGDLILRNGSKCNMILQYFHKVATETTFCADTDYFDGRHTWLSSFFSGNWILTSCSVRMFVMTAPFRPMILGWYLGSTVIVNL